MVASSKRVIPITPGKLTSDILHACERKHLDGSGLASWAEALLDAGFESDAIIDALVAPEMHWQKVPVVFAAICRDIGLSPDVTAELAPLRQQVMIEEYRLGLHHPAELLHRLDDLRRRIGFPEQIYFRLLEDNEDGTNDSGYYGMDSGKRGKELETMILAYLEKAGIRRQDVH